MNGVFDLSGKTALVTGASRGIGLAIATGLARAGADVAVNSRTRSALDQVVAEVTTAGRRAVPVPADVTDRDAAHDMVAAALDEFDHLDIVVNNAGGTPFAAPFVDIRFSGWTKATRLNLESVVHVLQAAGPHLLARKSGSVINVASIAAAGGTPMLAHYGAAKSAVVSLTRSVAMEWGRANVRVNALCPGWTTTELSRSQWEDPDASSAITDQVPLGRWARPEEMVGAAVFLASDASSYVTGHALYVDGGLTAK